MKKYVKALYSDIAPLEGRKEMPQWQVDSNQVLTWEGTYCSLAGDLIDNSSDCERSIRLQGSIYSQNNSTPKVGWIEIETITSQQAPSITDLYLVGTRPLPQPNITCVSRHPVNKDYLVAATSNSHLLLLDGCLHANLAILAQIELTFPLVSLVCCGKRLLGLGTPSAQSMQIIDIITGHEPLPSFVPGSTLALAAELIALAENDSCSAWGLTAAGEIYYLPIPVSQYCSPIPTRANRRFIGQIGRLSRPPATTATLRYRLKGIYGAINNMGRLWRCLSSGQGAFLG